MSYTSLPTSDGLESDVGEKVQRDRFNIRRLTSYPWVLLATILSVLAMAFILVAVTIRSSGTNQPSYETCGTSASEALSRGCSFDVMSFAWLPSRCFDGELMDQFVALRDWKWYSDAQGMRTVDYTAVAAGEYDELYVTQEFHMYHCTYMWRKMHRAVQAGQPLDGYIGDYHHTAHCEMQILDQHRGLNETSTTIYTKFVNCPYAQIDSGRWGWYRMIDGHQVHRDP